MPYTLLAQKVSRRSWLWKEQRLSEFRSSPAFDRDANALAARRDTFHNDPTFGVSTSTSADSRRSGRSSPTKCVTSTVQPRRAEVDAADSTIEEKRDAPVEKRGLTGFNAALNFAAGALMTSPEVQLGTGKAGSGVGITVSPGASAGGGTKVGKREEGTTLNLLKIRSFGESN
ncbi:unnamed protein product [Sphagnum balticum]